MAELTIKVADNTGAEIYLGRNALVRTNDNKAELLMATDKYEKDGEVKYADINIANKVAKERIAELAVNSFNALKEVQSKAKAKVKANDTDFKAL